MEGDDTKRGALLLIGAAFFFSLMTVQVKLAGAALPVEMLVLARGVVTLVLSYAAIRRAGLSPWGHDRTRLVLRGVFGLGGLACFYFAVTRLPLAEVTVIHYLNPILTTALAAMLLGERVGWPLAGALGVSLAGTVLVARPTFLFGGGGLDPAGVAAALGGAVFSAFAYTTVRRLRLTDDPNVIVFYFPLVAVPITVPFALRAWVWPSARGWLLMLGLGICTQIAQVLMTRGLALVPAGRGTAIGYVQIAFAAVWGLLLFAEVPSGGTFAGAILVLAATWALTRTRSPRTAAASR